MLPFKIEEIFYKIDLSAFTLEKIMPVLFI